MPYRVSIYARDFHFRFVARTSRGIMESRRCHFLEVTDLSNHRTGTGEAAPIAGLSEEDEQRVVADLASLKAWAEAYEAILPSDLAGAGEIGERLGLCSSVQFAFEMALAALNSTRDGFYFEAPLHNGVPVPVNGLVWMAGINEMKAQAVEKAAHGYRCIKFKVGSESFDAECEMLEWLRGTAWGRDLEIRLDANGAFKAGDVMNKLERLATFRIHSIEQPVKAGNRNLMRMVCSGSPIPVALDEELIGVYGKERSELVDDLKPAYLVIKPTLHGGFSSALDWKSVAINFGAGWWLTSSLESPVGLSALAQFASSLDVTMAQGLGTGEIYSDAGAGAVEVRSGLLYKR